MASWRQFFVAFVALLSLSLLPHGHARLPLQLPQVTRQSAQLSGFNNSALAGAGGYSGTLVAALKGTEADAGDAKSTGHVTFSIFE